MHASYLLLPHLLPLGALRCVFDGDAACLEAASDGIGGRKIAARAGSFTLGQLARDPRFELWVDGGRIGDDVEDAVHSCERGSSAFERNLIRSDGLVELAIRSANEVEECGDSLGCVQIIEERGF